MKYAIFVRGFLVSFASTETDRDAMIVQACGQYGYNSVKCYSTKTWRGVE